MSDCYWYGSNPFNYSPGECKEDIDNLKLYTINLHGDIVNAVDTINNAGNTRKNDILKAIKNAEWHSFSFFRLQLKILYQVLCFLSHLSVNFWKRTENYHFEHFSKKLYFKFDYSAIPYLSYFMNNDSSIMTCEIRDCVEGDNFCGGRVITDTYSTVSTTADFTFVYEFEVFCPYLDLQKIADNFLSGLSSDFKKSLFEMVEKNLHLTNSINFKQDANFKQTHSKSFMKFLNEKIKDNSSSLVEKLNLSEFVSNAQTELELPSSANTSLSLYNAVLNSVDWWTDLLNLFVDFVNSLNEYSQTSKIDRILECEFDSKKFNRLLGDALNYATGGEIDPDFPDRLKEPVVERNDQPYVDLNPDGQIALDWDGGLPALVNHRHYNFKKFLCFLRDSENNKFFTSEEFKRLFKQVFIPGEEI